MARDTKGAYTFVVTNSAGDALKTYGPWELEKVRELRHALKVTPQQLEFAIEIATKNPGVPYVLSGRMKVPDPLGIEKEEVAISWTGELTYNLLP